MQIKKMKKERPTGFFKVTIIEFLFEMAWSILMFLPRIMIRFIKEIW